MSVTVKPKCYTKICCGCNMLFQSERSDALTCSTRCRVQAHRNGSLKELRARAELWRIHPSLISMAHAVRLLCPELSARIEAGEVELEEAEVQAEVSRAFIAVLFSEARRAEA